MLTLMRKDEEEQKLLKSQLQNWAGFLMDGGDEFFLDIGQ